MQSSKLMIMHLKKTILKQWTCYETSRNSSCKRTITNSKLFFPVLDFFLSPQIIRASKNYLATFVFFRIARSIFLALPIFPHPREVKRRYVKIQKLIIQFSTFSPSCSLIVPRESKNQLCCKLNLLCSYALKLLD